MFVSRIYQIKLFLQLLLEFVLRLLMLLDKKVNLLS